jgi:hypothetical protein
MVEPRNKNIFLAYILIQKIFFLIIKIITLYQCILVSL